MRGVNIFLADGFEDIEALAVSDVLRRAGVKVDLVSVTGELVVRSSHNVAIYADKCLSDCEFEERSLSERDVMIFPGGMPGAKTLSECEPLIGEMRRHYECGGGLAAICASPGLVLSKLGSLEGLTMTCFDGFEGGILECGGKFVRKCAVRSGRVVTGRSAGYAVEFGLGILEMIQNREKSGKIRAAMLLNIE